MSARVGPFRQNEIPQRPPTGEDAEGMDELHE